MKPEVRAKLEKQHYKIVGPNEHSAVKLCHWTKADLKEGRHCYKGDFYGLDSKKCMQITPTADHCNFRCRYCWRHHGFTSMDMETVDHPSDIISGALEAHRLLLTGYKGHPTVDFMDWQAAQRPEHVAISLTGEPTMYPHLSELIEECHKYGMTTFLVTNGSFPEAIANLDTLPTQLYVSVDAPNEKVFKELCIPTTPNAWEKLQQTLELLPSLDCRTVCRHTLVKGYSLDYVDDYAKQDRIAEPDFVEAKGYVFVGESRNRLTINHMPSHAEVLEFAHAIAGELGYHYRAESPQSRAALCSRTMADTHIPREAYPVATLDPFNAKDREAQGLPPLGEKITLTVAGPAPTVENVFYNEEPNAVLDMSKLTIKTKRYGAA